MIKKLLVAAVVSTAIFTLLPSATTAATRDDALATLKKATTYYRTQVAAHGGYVYYYSEDLQQRWGEGVANRDQIFVQPPGTPAVGMAYLRAYSATGDAFYLKAAKEAAHALIYGQLQSGGWRQTIDFDPKGSMVGLYRNGRGQERNHTSLDDNQTQAAILFLMRIDAALKFQDATIAQQADGLIPGIVQFTADGKASWKNFKGFPPIWVVSADLYVEQTNDTVFLAECLTALEKQIGWFEAKRSVSGGGFYYLDILQDTWESGMDEGIRYHERPAGPAACVDACSHVFLLYDHAARWSKRLGRPATKWETKAKALQRFIEEKLWDAQTDFFYDAWIVNRPERRHLAFEGMWPVVVGAVTPAQAHRVIDEHLLNPKEFFSPHPISTVALSDSRFELRMWRGPTWNCMTYWAARGCLRYGRNDDARKLLEAALDATAKQFERTGTIWEFYHPLGGEPESLKRKPTGRNQPCRDYLGHNPLFAMADLWRRCGGVP